MTKPKYQIIKDVMCRMIPVEHDHSMMRSEPVITKEEFIACYNEWIKKEEE